jgi:hypothetical protein
MNAQIDGGKIGIDPNVVLGVVSSDGDDVVIRDERTVPKQFYRDEIIDLQNTIDKCQSQIDAYNIILGE